MMPKGKVYVIRMRPISMDIYNINPDEFERGTKQYENHEGRDPMYRVAMFLVKIFFEEPDKVPEETIQLADALETLLLTWNQAFYRYGKFDSAKLQDFVFTNLSEVRKFRSETILELSYLNRDDIQYLFSELLEALRIDTIRFSDKNKRNRKEDLEAFLEKIGVRHDGSRDLKTLYDSIKENDEIRSALEFIRKRDSASGKNSIEVRISKLGNPQVEALESLRLIRRSPVAVSKALHLLAPGFFPLWDGKIARAYKCSFEKNPAEKYFLFCTKIKLVAEKVIDFDKGRNRSLVKLIDEYNYSKFTKNWMNQT
jgi:hypothetical protein